MTLAPAEINESAHCYLENGIAILPIERGTKHPRGQLRAYAEKPISTQTVAKFFDEQTNIAGFVGTISDNLASIDIDQVIDFQHFREQLPSAARRHFKDLEDSAWIMESARAKIDPGRRQIFFRTPYPVKTRNLKESGYEIRGQCGGWPQYSVLPPSVFRTDDQQLLPYAWQSRPGKIIELTETDVADLSFLGLVKADEVSNNDILRPLGLSQMFWEILRFGHYERHKYFPKSGGSRTRSDAELHIVTYLAKQGFDFPSVLEVFESFASQKSKYRELGTRSYDWLRKNYDRSTQYLGSHQTEFYQELAKVAAWEFTGRTRHTDRAVLNAFLTIARRIEKPVGLN